MEHWDKYKEKNKDPTEMPQISKKPTKIVIIKP